MRKALAHYARAFLSLLRHAADADPSFEKTAPQDRVHTALQEIVYRPSIKEEFMNGDLWAD